jgi:hypothetical protein
VDIGHIREITVIQAKGRGNRQMCKSDKFGFPRGSAKSVKRVQGFQTGDRVRLVQPKGKYQGTHEGVVAFGPTRCSTSPVLRGKITAPTSSVHLALSIRWVHLSPMNKKDGEKDIWTRFQEDDSLTVDNMITVDMSSHMLFDRHGEVLPAAVFFDYTSSGIDESSHDLLALAEHLLQRPDIRVYSGHRHRGEMEGRNIATSAKDAIFDIPHYNVQEGRTQSVQFAWIPFHDDYKRVWALCKGKYPSTQIRERFRELDIVGMRQFDLSQKKRPRP